APGWNDEQVVRFFFGGQQAPADYSAANLRETTPPWQREPRTPWQQPAGPEYDIIHFVLGADQLVFLGDREPGVRPEGWGRDSFRAGGLRDRLVGSQTRLLILHGSEENTGLPFGRWTQQVYDLAAYIVGGGGPAVLVVLGRGDDLDDYSLNFYREL